MKATTLILISTTPIAIFVIHMITARLFAAPAKRQKTAVGTCLGGSVLVALGASAIEGTILGATLALCFSLLLAHIYFQFFNMSETARRIRILSSIHSAVPINSEVLSNRASLEVRLGRLLDLGQITQTGDVLVAKSTLLLIVSVGIRKLERLLFPERA